MTPLHYAVAAGNSALVNLLLKKNASLTVKNKDELTPFQLAQKLGKQEIAAILSEKAEQLLLDKKVAKRNPDKKERSKKEYSYSNDRYLLHHSKTKQAQDEKAKERAKTNSSDNVSNPNEGLVRKPK